ncbi:MAG: hypothetical protein KDD43_05550, partial [Bdellovibrionales bacterium]|nr:hypothetical protein [Bdellovibrionales bacterium]
MIRVLAIVLSLALLVPSLAQEEEGGGSTGAAPAEAPQPPPEAPKSEGDKGSEAGDEAPTAEAKPLISDPPKRLDEAKSSKKKKPKKKKKRRNKKKPTAKSGKGNKESAKKPKVKGQWGIVQTDGAAAYKVPNFDAPVKDYLKAGQKLRISQKVYQGIGGFGAFYKVKISGKSYGYVADVDIAPEYKAPNNFGKGNQKADKNPDFNRDPNEPPEEQVPIFFTRYIGGTFGTVNFTEKFSGRKFSSGEWMAGLRMSGPGTIAEGLPMDLGVLFHSGAPSYYESDIAGGNPSGFFVLADLFLPYPFLETEDSLISWGLGFMATYTKFSLQIKNTIFDSQELRAGLALQAGYSLRFDKYLVRLEAKYYYERTDYLGYFL